MSIASHIDHTQLSLKSTEQEIIQLCEEAKQYEFAAVCVLPCRVPLAKHILGSTNVRVCTVIGFPLGANNTAVKVAEANLAVTQGADEIDMVINLGWLKDGNWNGVEDDIIAVRKACPNIVLKVILETGLLTTHEKILMAKMCERTKVDFIKTSTGSTHGGATLEDVSLLKTVGGELIKVKASGGIKTYEQAATMINAGADRIGTSTGVAIINEAKRSIQ